MERELKKNLMEIEHLIKDHEQRGNTHTQSVLQIAYEVIEPCAKVARTLPDLKEILERDTEKEAIITGDNHAIGCKVGVCPKCNREYEGVPALSRIDNETLICPECGTAQALDAALEGSDMPEKEKQAYKDGVLRAIYK